MSLERPPKAFLTDVFGTVVDWRKTVTDYLTRSAAETLNSASASIPSSVRLKVDEVSWPDFAQQWRKSYYHFTRSYDPDTMPWKTIDQHHLESLIQLTQEHGIDGLWSDEELSRISMIWHFLDPWPDSSPGLKSLSTKFTTSTLSNGGQQLLKDLSQHGDLAYSHFISSQDFKAYKPNPKVYNGAAELLHLPTSECALVAAHLGDLKAAKGCGYQTVYIERVREEEWSAEDIEKARTDGWVDMWIEEGEGGFKELARRFGVRFLRDEEQHL